MLTAEISSMQRLICLTDRSILVNPRKKVDWTLASSIITSHKFRSIAGNTGEDWRNLLINLLCRCYSYKGSCMTWSMLSIFSNLNLLPLQRSFKALAFAVVTSKPSFKALAFTISTCKPTDLFNHYTMGTSPLKRIHYPKHWPHIIMNQASFSNTN